ncbi:hypothetical protein ASD50_01515 [Mesorhizobium sp. Root552]|uniref:ABC transporter ATP-binding protein/permease n=1 Tax=Mesorhizobium sp. Root552 TaxID=1736555 RepID=UPI0006F90029|nr:ABC transporter ATP-binding protein/permease [Mesorhizobium sp. Root552]KQZ29465.1 hypothetical protein ASD50_01515 [Mesorhizobium sp. Root552]
MLVLRHIIRLMKLCIRGPGGKVGIAYYVVVLALELADIAVSLRMIAWTKDFYDALQQANAPEALRQIGIFSLIVLVAVALGLSSTYLRKLLEIRWRGALTSQILDRWLEGKAYLRMKRGADGSNLDNPDQRIAEDCRIFLAGATMDHGSASGIISMSLDLVTRIVALFSYVALLWSLSAFALDLSFIGIDAELPRYMVWAAFAYVALSSGITHLLGRPLKQLYVWQQRREADYRFALVRLRENAEAVALSDGEPSERKEIDTRFTGIIANWRQLINRELILSLFTAPYHRTVLRIPIFLALPVFFAGNLTFGSLMQLGSAFSSVVTTLSWFIFAYRPLAELAAASSRLGRFLEEMDKHPQGGIHATIGPSDKLVIANLSLSTPQGRRLLDVPGLDIERGETVWLKGASGIGKTTLLKALAAIWPYGSGRLVVPSTTSTFLPQHPYLPLGGIADAVAYPRSAGDLPDGDIKAALAAAGFPSERMSMPIDGLSGGEHQRLALARLFLHRPAWIFLDEAMSALDTRAENHLLKRLRHDLPGSTFVIVSHRSPEAIGGVRIVDLDRSKPAGIHAGTMEDA